MLSIRQPWAWAIIYAGKDVENRSWSTNYRGPLLIHASKREDPGARVAVEALSATPLAPTLPTGSVIGVVGVLRNADSKWAIPGKWHWILTDARPLPFEACRGQLGLFELNADAFDLHPSNRVAPTG